MAPPWERGTKACIKSPGYMTKIAAIYVFLKSCSSNQELEDLETWGEAFMTQALQSLYK